MLNNRQIDSLDILAFFSFFIGLVNYEETITQSGMQDTVQSAVEDIHKHLEMQDAKIDKILEMVGERSER